MGPSNVSRIYPFDRTGEFCGFPKENPCPKRRDMGHPILWEDFEMWATRPTMYPSNSAGFSKAVSSEWGWTLNAQPSPLIGVSFNTNSSGTLIGVTTATDPGGSATYGYNWCADF